MEKGVEKSPETKRLNISRYILNSLKQKEQKVIKARKAIKARRAKEAKMTLVKCNRCGKSYSVRSMLADSSGKGGLVCQNCFELISKVRSDADRLIQKKWSSMAELGLRKTPSKTSRRGREGREYVCVACNYRFISSLDIKKCPYCSEAGKLMVMEEVVNEIDDILRR